MNENPAKSKSFEQIDKLAIVLAKTVIRYRWTVLLSALLIGVLVGSGAQHLGFSTNYRVFFSDSNPELLAFEDLQNTYTKNDNFFFVISPKDGRVFSPETLSAIEEITRKSWKIPYALRVDSISNFQHSYAVGDELIVEDLIKNATNKPQEHLEERKTIALKEPLLVKQLINPEATISAVNVVLQYPEKSAMEVPEAVEVARQLKSDISAAYPHLDVYLTGVSMLNNAFAETGMLDGQNLMPIMFAVIFILSFLVTRSLSSTATIFSVILLSTMVAMGFAGFVGIPLTPISMSAPVVILTLAVADSIHIILSLRSFLRSGMDKLTAITEAIRVNFLAVSITSLTTIVGFLMLNFSDAPPYWHLGNITAVGIASAWLFSLLLIPALLSILPLKHKVSEQSNKFENAMEALASWVINHRKTLFYSLSIFSILLIALIPSIQFNDQWVKYFDERIDFRVDSDIAQKDFGLYPIEYSVPANGVGGVSEPEYLANLEKFADYLRQHPSVTHVYSISDIMKRLNKNMHEDNETYYRIPNDRDLSAQYLLLYELSLPYGLDLNDRINIDKSASRVTATVARTTSEETKAFFADVENWQKNHWPEYMLASPTSAAVMFTYISERNFNNMIKGTLLGVAAIAVIMMLALNNFKIGLLSLIPNGLPILTTFGAWALLVGEVGFSIATVASISLGIIVDDTVHFLTKYLRGRSEHQLSKEDAIRYAFKNVGIAILINTFILTCGFLVMTYSAFKLNVDLGLMTFLAIIFALILDFLFLPTLLLMGNPENKKSQTPQQTAQLPTPQHP